MSSKRDILIIVVALFAGISCTQEKQPGDGNAAAPGVTDSARSGKRGLQVIPKNAVLSSTLSLIPTGFDLAGATIEWIINGRPFENGPAQLRAADLHKGDTVEARAIINGSEIRSDQVTIVNSPPEVTSATVVLDGIAAGASLKTDVTGRDSDGDPVTFLYEWTKNGEPAGKESRIEGTLKRGDVVAVTITPYDGTDYGSSAVVRREMANMRPVITAHREFSFDGSVYTYQVNASDPDGDVLTYSLESPPDGMTIDASTGLLKWVVPPEFKGDKNVPIVVSDGNGGIAKYVISVTIK